MLRIAAWVCEEVEAVRKYGRALSRDPFTRVEEAKVGEAKVDETKVDESNDE